MYIGILDDIYNESINQSINKQMNIYQDSSKDHEPTY